MHFNLLALGYYALLGLRSAKAQVTVYDSSGTSTSSAAAATSTLAAYDDTVLDPPSVPNPAPSTAFTLTIPAVNTSVTGLSIAQSTNSFYGFSIEMSVLTQVCNTHLQPIFLNLMALIAQRGGRVRIRAGGNTQEFATYEEELPDANGKCITKQSANSQNPTETPAVIYNMDMFYLFANVSSLVDVAWFLGIPFNDTSNWRFAIAEYGESVLGDRLLGLQAANEPDLYVDHGHRDEGYDATSYYGEIQELISAMSTNDDIPTKNNLVVPSVAGDWAPELVWNTGILDTCIDSLSALAVEHYPNNNCYAMYGTGSYVDPQTTFPDYLNHTSGVSFGAALWALDYGLQMAYSNFTGAMIHVGGQNVYYNLLTAPPTNESTYHQWTIGSIFYSALVIAEVFGTSGTSQIMDLGGNDGSVYTPQYSIYENGNLAKVALFNYITDESGANDYTATITIDGGTVPEQVYVKYLLSDSVSTKNNITWAGQTLGTKYTVDGILKNDLNIVTITCDTSANTCSVPVNAPGFALVFLTESEVSEVTPESASTFATTAYTKTINTQTIDPSVLATSNGHSGDTFPVLGSTSKKSQSDALGMNDVLKGGSVLSLAVAWGAIAVLFI
ncbi:glycoside hydrolase family 79 protein [Desarmillaria tabescens]|uniref:Glycoside hydrolase family 79 protein n=1 Tax=Armillaria tabescens TaxID=1929756 RepID=A0AA39N1I5_ARMTA|nr:glycoside hydrolase family 79 protein [Desarmillaria tabescens]KAK0454068.1 glycoside hydrolase family 79 protein [Desarmillaria tabescens]